MLSKFNILHSSAKLFINPEIASCKSANCPTKADNEAIVSSQVSMPLSQSQLGQQLNIRNVMLVSVTENSESVGARETLSSLLNNPISTTPDCSPVFSTNEEVVVLKADLKSIKTQERGARAIIDSGSPITIAGLDWFRSYFNSMPKAIRSRLEVEGSKTTFQFGVWRR